MKQWTKHTMLVLAMLAMVPLCGQEIDQLKQQKVRLEQEIAFTQQQMKEVQQKRTLTANELATLKRQLQIREALIQNMNAQVRVYDRQIAESRMVINTLERDMEHLKKEYADMLVHTYKNNNNYSNLLFVFSSKSFNDAYKRMQYLRAYTDYRKQQASLIRKTLAALDHEVKGIEERKNAQRTLLKAEQAERSSLARDQQQVNKKIDQFRSQENEYKRQLTRKQQEADRLNKQIERMIAEATRKAREAAAGTATAGTGKALPALTPEAMALSNSFSANKGKLPWPVERGTIVRNFGTNPHPALPGITLNNNGVDIATTKEAEVRAIFAGKVTNTFYHPTFNRGVIINHGEYFTVYLNMKEVTVKENQQVSTKQVIGRAFSDTKESGSEVHLEIWKGTTLLNPSLWLNR
jgi:murein hydrolase activator